MTGDAAENRQQLAFVEVEWLIWEQQIELNFSLWQSNMENDGVKEALDEQNNCLLDLPEEILHRIRSLHLPSLKDRIRFSAVSKELRSLAPPIWTPRSPWLLFTHKKDGTCYFFDPLAKSTYITNVPDFKDATFHHSKYGWVVASQNQDSSWFFYNPFTNQRIDLPNLETAVQGVSFSTPPTSRECVVFAIQSFSASHVNIYTCHPSDERWATFEDTANNNDEIFILVQNNPVYYRGHFYCIGLKGNVGTFNPTTNTWKMLEIPMRFKHRTLSCYLVESGGELFSFTTGFGFCPASVANPVHVFRLDHGKMTWMKVENLGDGTAFLSQETSICGSLGIKEMENKIYFPSFQQGSPDDMVVYSLDVNHFHFRTKAYANRTWIDARGYMFESCHAHASRQLKFVGPVENS